MALRVMMDKHSSALLPSLPHQFSVHARAAPPLGLYTGVVQNKGREAMRPKKCCSSQSLPIAFSALQFPTLEQLRWLEKRQVAQHDKTSSYDRDLVEAWRDCHSRF